MFYFNVGGLASEKVNVKHLKKEKARITSISAGTFMLRTLTYK